MKKRYGFFILMALVMNLFSPAVYAQSASAAVSPEFGRAAASIADFIIASAEKQQHSGDLVYLKFDSYSMNDLRTEFGILLSSAISAEVIDKGSGKVGVIAADYMSLLARDNHGYQLPNTDLIVTGRIFKLAEKLVIQTSLIDPARGIIAATHTAEIEITPELFPLLSSSSGQAIADLYEPDGPENPTIVEGEFSDHNHTLSPGDEDWYEYRSGRNGLVNFGTAGDLDTVITVFGPDDRYSTLTGNDDSGGSENARVSLMTEIGKSYYFQIQGYEGEQSGPYTVFLNFEDFNDPQEPNNRMSDALAFPIDEGRLDCQFYPQGDVDWYSFTVPENPGPSVPIVIETHSGIDPLISLYDADGAMIGSNDDDGVDYNARLSADVQPGRTYYLEVSEIDSGTGGYMLSISGPE